MQVDIVKAQADNALTHNYNRWIFDSISSFVGKRVMDVGCGCGNFLSFLSDREIIVNIDILDIFVNSLREACDPQNNARVFKYDIQDEGVIELGRKYRIDTVICNNVLEHVRDDLKALANINRLLEDNGRLVLILPALRFLYSKWDASIGHFRRYNYEDIQKKLRSANFSIEKSFYMNMLGVLAWFVNGRVFRNTPTKSAWVRKQAVFFDRYLVWPLRMMESVLPPKLGQSLIVIARKI